MGKELEMRNGEVVDAEPALLGYVADCPECNGQMGNVAGDVWRCPVCGTMRKEAGDTDA